MRPLVLLSNGGYLRQFVTNELMLYDLGMTSNSGFGKKDKKFLKGLIRAVKRAAETCEGPMMLYFPDVKVGSKLGSWSRRLRQIEASIEQEIDRLSS